MPKSTPAVLKVGVPMRWVDVGFQMSSGSRMLDQSISGFDPKRPSLPCRPVRCHTTSHACSNRTRASINGAKAHVAGKASHRGFKSSFASLERPVWRQNEDDCQSDFASSGSSICRASCGPISWAEACVSKRAKGTSKKQHNNRARLMQDPSIGEHSVVTDRHRKSPDFAGLFTAIWLQLDAARILANGAGSGYHRPPFRMPTLYGISGTAHEPDRSLISNLSYSDVASKIGCYVS
jgi:hypothetical protein